MIGTEGILLVILILLSCILALTRSAYVQTHLPGLLNLQTGREEMVEKVTHLLDQPRFRLDIRLAQMTFHTLAAGMVYLIYLQMSGPAYNLWLGLLVLFGFSLILILLEYGLDSVAMRSPEEWSIRMYYPAALFSALFSPFSFVLSRVIDHPDVSRGISAPTDDELKSWVENGQSEGTLEKDERRMIYSIFQFADTLAREIMVPRISMFSLDVTTPVAKAIELIGQSGHSRIPVYEDTVDNLVGILYVKDMLRYTAGNEMPESLRSILRPAYFVPEAKKADELLTEMQNRHVHMAIVVDEYGGVAGLVTLEDITEEIIGEIQDEYDQMEELPYQVIQPGEVVFLGSIDLDDFNEIMDTHLEKESADTLGGFIYSQMGRVPAGGEKMKIGDLDLTVEHVVGRRIHKVRASRPQTAAESMEVEKNDNE
jgi:CBS domain containing-hemolysin-like protein